MEFNSEDLNQDNNDGVMRILFQSIIRKQGLMIDHVLRKDIKQ